eukprot:TRINITY_DN3551_c1_g1_i1.p1 TRINITY_DN3551_c1_g1~~TRINITY_DN3551_c1_g1_i1.p1  ORF type:complete len:120 (-),score=9.90 TRINITY_DN3551_c1_g1_i1:104-463(-)
MVSPNFKLSLWASQVALLGCFLLFGSGVVSFYYPNGTKIAAYSVVISTVLAPFLYPVEKLGCLLYVVNNYYIAALLCCGLAIYPFFLTPTVIGGVVLVLASIMYLVGAIRGEGKDDAKK